MSRVRSYPVTLYTNPNIKDYCWGAGGIYWAYGLGPDLRYNDNCLQTEGTYFHEGHGTLCLMIDPREQLIALWFAQFDGDQYHAEAIYNAAAIIWSGLE